MNSENMGVKRDMGWCLGTVCDRVMVWVLDVQGQSGFFLGRTVCGRCGPSL